MKIQKFLIWIQEKLLNYPDISFSTVKMFIDKFKKCLSEKELDRHNILIHIISELSLKQISLDSFVHNSKVDNLENQLNNLKNDNIE